MQLTPEVGANLGVPRRLPLRRWSIRTSWRTVSPERKKLEEAFLCIQVFLLVPQKGFTNVSTMFTEALFLLLNDIVLFRYVSSVRTTFANKS